MSGSPQANATCLRQDKTTKGYRAIILKRFGTVLCRKSENESVVCENACPQLGVPRGDSIDFPLKPSRMIHPCRRVLVVLSRSEWSRARGSAPFKSAGRGNKRYLHYVLCR